MRRYFITGGTGFIGRELVRQLCSRKDTEEIVLLTRDAQKRYEMYSWGPVKLYEGDITKTTFPQSRFTDIIHGANEANDLLQPDQDRYYYTIVEGTKRIVDWHTRNQHSARFLLLSSGVIHKGDTTYTRGKAMAEHLCRFVASIARIYSVIGEEMPLNGQYAAGKFFGQARQGEVRYYDAGYVRSYLHVEDCARWCLQILDQNHVRSIYDVGSLEAIHVADLAQRIATAMSVPCVDITAPLPHPTAQIYLPDPEKLPPFCEQKINLDAALERIACSFRS